MIHRDARSNAFTFVRIASLRAAQLTKGCVARVPASHRHTLTAQLEVVAGKVAFTSATPPGNTAVITIVTPVCGSVSDRYRQNDRARRWTETPAAPGAARPTV